MSKKMRKQKKKTLTWIFIILIAIAVLLILYFTVIKSAIEISQKGVPSNGTCRDGDKSYRTCPDGSKYTFANCINGKWMATKFFLNPCASHQVQQSFINCPDGFTNCWSNTKKYYDCKATAKIYTAIEDGESSGEFVQGGLIANVDFVGDKLYLFKGEDVESLVADGCDETGCSGEEISPGQFTLASVGETGTQYAFVSWKTMSNENCSVWTYTYYFYDYAGKKFVECFDDNQCPSGICDATSNTCKILDGTTYQCANGDEKCSGMNYFSCENYKWVSKGQVSGKCYYLNEPVCCDSYANIQSSGSTNNTLKIGNITIILPLRQQLWTPTTTGTTGSTHWGETIEWAEKTSCVNSSSMIKQVVANSSCPAIPSNETPSAVKSSGLLRYIIVGFSIALVLVLVVVWFVGKRKS